MDGEHLSPREVAALDQHLARCSACSSFEKGTWRLREQARFQVAVPVPDLVEDIMAAVATAPRPTQTRARVFRPQPRQPWFPRLARTLAPAMAALVVGVLVGSLAVGGPWQRPSNAPSASADDVTRGVQAAAANLTAYHATFQITELNFAPDVPVRQLSMDVWFQAPERFRLDVADQTRYPGTAWTPTDLRLVVDGPSWYSSGPAPCPTVQCPAREVLVRNRVPFSPTTPTPTDLVLPITTLSDANQLTVIGRGTVLGRSAIEVEIPFERAQPLFPFLSLGGEWRPFFPNDRVLVWLDAKSWSPLQYKVFPASGQERDQWALRFGLPQEPARRAIFLVTATETDRRAPAAGTFAIPETKFARDQGATTVTLSGAQQVTGFAPVTPNDVAGLDLYQVVVPSKPDTVQTPDETLITYSRGLTWLKLGETRNWSQDTLYGPVAPQAQEVHLPNGGVAYYEPATADHGRRLSIHAAGADLYVETNLPRARLIEVAGSLPVVGESLPESWRIQASGDGTTERVSLEQAAGELPFPVLVPSGPPTGYDFASAELIRIQHSVGLNVYYQQDSADMGAGQIRLHMEAGTELPPASSADQSAVAVGGAEGRWTPDGSRLEWVQDGVYFSLDGSGLELSDLLAVARSLVAYSPAAPVPSPVVSASQAVTSP
jgi:hypothetical protein